MPTEDLPPLQDPDWPAIGHLRMTALAMLMTIAMDERHAIDSRIGACNVLLAHTNEQKAVNVNYTMPRDDE